LHDEDTREIQGIDVTEIAGACVRFLKCVEREIEDKYALPHSVEVPSPKHPFVKALIF